MVKSIPFFLVSLLLSCNFIPASVPNTSIKGSDIKNELKKEAQSNIVLTLGGYNSAFTAAQGISANRQCPGFTTDTTNPSFQLPEPSAYTNVNLSGSITGSSNATVTQSWVSEQITTVSYIDVKVTNVPTCIYRLNAAPTSGTGTSLSSSNTITVDTVPATLYINCTTNFTSTTYNYTISLNPRPKNLPSNQPLSDQNSIFNLISEQTAPLVAGIKDDTIYTYASFEKCKSNFTLTVLAYISALPTAAKNYQECGIYNPPPQQFITQGLLCDLQEAKFIETN